MNPAEPRAWAYRAVLAHLDGKPDEEAAARKSALSRWAENPEVDHLIGRKLSQKYRFAEGAAAQKRALAMDPDYLPAKVQLCQDLLRLGDEEEGWKLADEIFAQGRLQRRRLQPGHAPRPARRVFARSGSDGFLVRMEPREADLYGARVLDLLRPRPQDACARSTASTLTEPVIVEIFPRRKEFAVRTFGLPGADGLLGVCFGRVITANSPASQGENPSNWEAVLWHEFCHVVTLTKTRNKMPRWLSEGISVYEEGQEDPSWATDLDPQFRAMILGDELTPLSQAQLGVPGAPRLRSTSSSPISSRPWRSISWSSKFGLPALKGLLDDLGRGNLDQRGAAAPDENDAR